MSSLLRVHVVCMYVCMGKERAYLAILKLEDQRHFVAINLLVYDFGGNPALGGVWLPCPGARLENVSHDGWESVVVPHTVLAVLSGSKPPTMSLGETLAQWQQDQLGSERAKERSACGSAAITARKACSCKGNQKRAGVGGGCSGILSWLWWWCWPARPSGRRALALDASHTACSCAPAPRLLCAARAINPPGTSQPPPHLASVPESRASTVSPHMHPPLACIIARPRPALPAVPVPPRPQPNACSLSMYSSSISRRQECGRKPP